MSIEEKGLDAFKARLSELIVALPTETVRAMYGVGLEVMKDSIEHTPVDTGSLRASHVLEIVGRSDGRFREGVRPEGIKISVGGPSAPYALFVHENLEAHHPSGEAKFLENAANRARSNLAERIVRLFDRNKLRGR